MPKKSALEAVGTAGHRLLELVREAGGGAQAPRAKAQGRAGGAGGKLPVVGLQADRRRCPPRRAAGSLAPSTSTPTLDRRLLPCSLTLR